MSKWVPRFAAFGGRFLLALIAIAQASQLTRARGAEGPLMPLPPVQEAQTKAVVQTVGWSSDGPVASTDSMEDFSERLQMLEDAYRDHLRKPEDNQQKSLKGYVKPGHDGATLDVCGRIHFDVWGFPASSPGVNGFESGDPLISPQDRLGFRRVRFGVKGTLPSNMLYKIEMEFAEGEDPQYRDVYLGWNELPLLHTLLLGNMKRPYGLDHLNSSRYNVFMERPFVIDGFNEDARRPGVCSYGYSEDLAWNWRYGVFNQRNIQDEGNYIGNNWQPQIAGRLANSLWYDQSCDGRCYAHWAISGTWADTDESATTENYAGSGRSEAQFRARPRARSVTRWLDTGLIENGAYYTLLGAEAVLNLGAVQFVGEYQSVWMNRIGGETDLRFDGAYGYVSYFLTGEHIPWDRETGTLGRVKPFENFFLVDRCRCGEKLGMGAWQVAVRWSYADFADKDIQGGFEEGVTLGLNWHWNPYARMQLNHIFGQISQNAFNAAPGAPDFGSYQVFGVRFMVDF